jgi:hypothetical protein
MSYKFTTREGETYGGEVDVSKEQAYALQDGQPITVRYLDGQPTINAPTAFKDCFSAADADDVPTGTIIFSSLLFLLGGAWLAWSGWSAIRPAAPAGRSRVAAMRSQAMASSAPAAPATAARAAAPVSAGAEASVVCASASLAAWRRPGILPRFADAIVLRRSDTAPAVTRRSDDPGCAILCFLFPGTTLQ